MKTVIITFCLLFTSSSSFAETRKEKKTQKEVISAFKQKGGGTISPKLQEALKKKIYSFDGNKVFPSFSHNVFWLNHLNPNFSISPRFSHEIIKESIWVTIPEKYHYEDIMDWRTKYKTIKVDDLSKPPTTVYGPWIIDKAAVPGIPDTWGGWVPKSTDVTDIVPGNKTMEGWAKTYRSDWLQANLGLTKNQADNRAETELSACVQSPSACNLKIAMPPGDAIARNLPSCTNSASVQCQGGNLVITGKYKEGGGQGGGEWKPGIDYETEERNLIPGNPGTPEEKHRDETLVYPKKDELVEDGLEEYDTGEDKKVTDEEEKKVLEEREEERIRRAKKEWKFSFAPAYFFDYDFGKMILNQFDGRGSRTIQSIKEGGRKIASRMSRQEDYSQDSQDYQEYQDYLDSQKYQNYQDRRTFQTSGYQSQSQQTQSMQQNGLPPSDLMANEIGPFVVKKFYNITAGLGATASANYANAGLLSQLGLSIALLPTLGGGATSIMVFDTLEYAEKAKHLNIPRSVEDILNWRTGDTLTYEVHGGVVFTGGAGFYGLAAGVSFLAQGLWQRTFSRIDETTVLAKLDRNKMFSMGMYGAAGLAGISLDKFIVKENALTFAIDISSDRGKSLLLDFMKGDMRKLQKAAENPKDPAVLSGMKLKGKTKGRSFSFGIGVPYLPTSARWNKSNFLSETNTDFLGSNRKKDSSTNGEVFSFKGRFFPLFKNTTEGFYSNVTYNTGAIPTFLQTFRTGQYAFSFQRSYADNEDLEEVLNSLMRKTGLIGLLDVKIAPDVEKVGSAEIKFAIKLKTGATNILLDQVNKNNLGVFDQIGQGFISAYFASLVKKRDDSLRLCPARTLEKCEKRMRKESEDAFSDMRKALITMSKLDSKTKNSREKFARAYSKFGDAMMVNPFTLQTVLSMTLGYGADVYLSVETTKTKKFEAILRGIATKAKK